MGPIVCSWMIFAFFPAQTRATNANLCTWMKDLSERTVDEQTGLLDENAETEINGSTVHVMWITVNSETGRQIIYYERSLNGDKTWQHKQALFSGPDSESTQIDRNSEYRRMAVLGKTVHIAVNRRRKNSNGKWYGALTYLLGEGLAGIPIPTAFTPIHRVWKPDVQSYCCPDSVRAHFKNALKGVSMTSGGRHSLWRRCDNVRIHCFLESIQ